MLYCVSTRGENRDGYTRKYINTAGPLSNLCERGGTRGPTGELRLPWPMSTPGVIVRALQYRYVLELTSCVQGLDNWNPIVAFPPH